MVNAATVGNAQPPAHCSAVRGATPPDTYENETGVQVALIIERHARAVFIRLPFAEAWAQYLAKGETPLLGHPQGNRWGTCREASGELHVYAGRLFLIFARTSAAKRRGGTTAALEGA